MALLENAAKAGISPLAFWDMTPREVVLSIEAMAWQAEREQERMLSLAWHIAALQRQKRLQSLRSLLRPRRKTKEIPIAERRREFAELKEIYNAYRARRSTNSDTGGTG